MVREDRCNVAERSFSAVDPACGRRTPFAFDDFSLDALVGPADLDGCFHRQDPAAACFYYTSVPPGRPKVMGTACAYARFSAGRSLLELLALPGGRPAVFDSQDVLRL